MLVQDPTPKGTILLRKKRRQSPNGETNSGLNLQSINKTPLQRQALTTTLTNGTNARST